MGSASDWRRLSSEMYGLRASDYDSAGESGEECTGCYAQPINREHLSII